MQKESKVDPVYKEKMIKRADILKAIAHPIRLCILYRLLNNKYLTVTDFTQCMDTSQSNISQHLSKLKNIDIVGFEKQGQMIRYFIKNEKVKDLVDLICRED